MLKRPMVWLLATLATGIAIAFLTGKSPEEYDWQRFTIADREPLGAAFGALRTTQREERRARNEVLFAHGRAVAARAAAAIEIDPGLRGAQQPPPRYGRVLEPVDLAAIVDTVERSQHAVADGSARRIRTVLAAVPRDTAWDRPYNANLGTYSVLPKADGSDGCVVLWQPDRLRHEQTKRSTIGVLGLCRWYAIYGAPGQAMREFLSTNRFSALRDVATRWDPAQGLQGGMRSRQVGAMRALMAPDGFRYVACSAYGGDACRHVALDDDAPPRNRSRINQALVPVAAMSDWHPLPLALIEQTVGPARFAELWRSDGSFTAAYAKVVGEPVETTVRRRIDEELEGRYVTGPTAPITVMLLAMVLVLGGVAWMGTERMRATAN